MTELNGKFTFNNVILRERLSATVSIPYYKNVIILIPAPNAFPKFGNAGTE